MPRIRNFIFQPTLEKTQEAVNDAYRAASTYLMFFADLSYQEMEKAINMVKETPLYEHEVKKACNTAIAKYEAIQKHIRCNMDKPHYILWLDGADEYASMMQPHVDILRHSVRQAMLTSGEPSEDIPVMTEVMIADAILRLSVINAKSYFADFRKHYGIDLEHHFDDVSMLPVLRAFQPVVFAFLDHPKGNVRDFDEDKNVSLAVDIIKNQMTSHGLINTAAMTALKKNPNILKDSGLDAESIEVDCEGMVIPKVC